MSEVAKMKLFCVIIFLATFACCTYTITMVHTEGQATDVVDETSTNSTEASASIPASLVK